jgi:3-oxoacyl-[acyl-carrier protein] reductase
MSSPRRLAIVTGASRGLGRLITAELVAADIDVLMIGRDHAALQRTAASAGASGKARTYALTCDLEAADAVALISSIAAKHGGADILVNNAAIQGPIGPAWEVDLAEFERTMRVDFLLPVALSQALLPGMIARGAGWIVNLSGGGASGPRPMFSAYGAAKTALVRFGETLAAEVAGKGVRVNSVAPGAFASRMTQMILEGGDRAGSSERASAERAIATEDDANAVKAAKLIAYLVAGDGRDITGKLISAVWDPWSELHQRWDEISANDVYTLRRIVPGDRKLSWGM